MPDIIYFLLSSMPLFTCIFLTIIFILEARQPHSTPYRWLAIFFLVCTLLYNAHFIFFMHEVAYIPYTDSIYCFCNLAVYPIYFIYLLSLTERHIKRLHIALLLTPATICGITAFCLYLLMPAQDQQTFIHDYLYQGLIPSSDSTIAMQAQAYLHIVQRLIFALEVIVVFWLGLRQIKHFNQKVNAFYSATEGKQLTSTRNLFIFFTATSFLSLTANIIGRYHFTGSITMLAGPAIFFSILLFCIGYIGLKQKYNIHDITPEADQLMEAQEEILPDAYDELQQRIIRLMQEKQIFLQPDLKIIDISQYLHTNRTYIYKAINIKMNMSFSEYINKQRIDYAANLMSQNQDIPLSEVARKSGFASVTSFYRNFKIFKNESPSSFREREKKQQSKA